MNDIEMETMLYELLQDKDAAPEIAKVETFEETGLLTKDRGVVVRTADGAEYQITIVESRAAPDSDEDDDDLPGPGERMPDGSHREGNCTM